MLIITLILAHRIQFDQYSLITCANAHRAFADIQKSPRGKKTVNTTIGVTHSIQSEHMVKLRFS